MYLGGSEADSNDSTLTLLIHKYIHKNKHDMIDNIW